VPTTLAQRQIALFHQAWKYEGNEFPLENMRLPPGTIIEMGAYKGMKMPHILELWDKQLDRIVQKLHPLSHLDPSPCQAMGPQKSVTSYCPTHSHFYYHGIEMRPSNFRWLAASELKLKGLKLRGVGVESLHTKPARRGLESSCATNARLRVENVGGHRRQVDELDASIGRAKSCDRQLEVHHDERDDPRPFRDNTRALADYIGQD
jgi:hypothetical protein